MKLQLAILFLGAAIVQISEASPLRPKRAAFYIANETACVVDNTVYFNGDPIPTDDPCEACKCRPPGFACVLKECEIKPGCRAIRRAGYCCPEYVCGCEHNGRMYRDGDEIRDNQNPCFVCHCQGSSIACAFIDCFFRVECAPEYVPGQCCPHYNSCFPGENSSNDGPLINGIGLPSSSEAPFRPTLLTVQDENSNDGTKSTKSSENESSQTDLFESTEKEEKSTTEHNEFQSTEKSQEATDITSSTTGVAEENDSRTDDQSNSNTVLLNSNTDLNIEESKDTKQTSMEFSTQKAEETSASVTVTPSQPEAITPTSQSIEPHETASETTQTEVVSNATDVMNEDNSAIDKQKSLKFSDEDESMPSTESKPINTGISETTESNVSNKNDESSTENSVGISKVETPSTQEIINTTEKSPEVNEPTTGMVEFLNPEISTESNKQEESTDHSDGGSEDGKVETNKNESTEQAGVDKIAESETDSTNTAVSLKADASDISEATETVTVTVSIKANTDVTPVNEVDTSNTAVSGTTTGNFYRALDEAIELAFDTKVALSSDAPNGEQTGISTEKGQSTESTQGITSEEKNTESENENISTVKVSEQSTQSTTAKESSANVTKAPESVTKATEINERGVETTVVN